MDLVTYNSNNDSSEDLLLATGMSFAFALGVCVAMQRCTIQKSEQIEIKEIEEIEEISPPSTPSKRVIEPSTPPAPRKKKTDDEKCVELDSDIIRFIARNPGVTVKQILNMMNKTYPEITKTEVNSRLYTMMHKKILNKIGEKGAPVWFLNNNSSTAII